MSADHCECTARGHHDPDDEPCHATVEYAGVMSRTTFTCSRPAGHDGPHAACTVVEHPVATWTDDEDEAQEVRKDAGAEPKDLEANK